MEEEKAGFQKQDLSRKRVRRRCQGRKLQVGNKYNFINMAEARREIVNALQLHRSSSSSSPLIGNSNSYMFRNSYNQYSNYQLLDTMPIPEPTWSTTAPTVSSAPVPPVELLEYFEWPEDVSSSYSWWVGFLNSMDDDNCRKSSEEKFGLMGSNCGEGFCRERTLECNVGSNNEHQVEVSVQPVDRNEQGSVSEDWLIFPTVDDNYGK